MAVKGQKPHCQAVSSDLSIASPVAVTLTDEPEKGSNAVSNCRRIAVNFSCAGDDCLRSAETL